MQHFIEKWRTIPSNMPKIPYLPSKAVTPALDTVLQYHFRFLKKYNFALPLTGESSKEFSIGFFCRDACDGSARHIQKAFLRRLKTYEINPCCTTY